MKKGEKNKAFDEFKNVLSFEPTYYNANIALSDILVDAKDYDNAIEEYRILKDLNPEYAKHLFALIFSEGR